MVKPTFIAVWKNPEQAHRSTVLRLPILYHECDGTFIGEWPTDNGDFRPEHLACNHLKYYDFDEHKSIFEFLLQQYEEIVSQSL